MKISAEQLTKFNMWRMPSGELCVRPGLRRIYTPSSRALIGGFSILSASTGEVWHYIWDIATSGSKDCKLRILDEDFATFQVFSYNADVEPRGLSYAQVQGQLLLGSPDLPPLWGLQGSGVRPATPVDSVSGFDVVDIPRGIISTWANRAVICSNDLAFISDPVAVTGGSIRSFTPDNITQRPGAIFGVHQAGGMLVMLTSAGVYGTDVAQAVVGTPSLGERLVSHVESSAYDTSCVVDGRVYALTKDGIMAADVEDGDEAALTEPYVPRAYGPRISLEDYRTCALLGGEHGPIVAAEGLNAAFMADLRTKVSGWWRSSHSPTDFKLRGILRDADGGDLLLCSNGVFRAAGDFDGEVALSSAVATQPKGFLFGALPSPPSASNLVRHIHVGADVGAGGSHYAAVRGKPLPTSAGSVGVTDPEGIQIGTDAWGTATKRYVTSSLQAISFTSSEAACQRTDDMAIEVGADVCLTRLQPIVEVEVSASAELRPAKVA